MSGLSRPEGAARRLLTALGAAGALIVAGVPSSLLSTASAASGGTGLRIDVLSSRADLVSDGDALVAITKPAGVDAASIAVTLNGRPISGVFSMHADGRFEALVKGLRLGANALVATMPNGSGAKLTLINHPNGGPMFEGTQVQPWICDNASGGNGPARNAQCDTPATYEYQYKDALDRQFKPYDVSSPPADSSVARTTTDQGKTVRYVVRVEHGTQDRGNYVIGALEDPAQPSQLTWNHKLLVPFGPNAGLHHGSGAPRSVLEDLALSRGFIVANNSLLVAGQNDNKVVAAEALTMLKERIVEQYGSPIRYTIGSGCSGGSIMQQMIAGAYPGLLDGIQPNCSFEDSWTTHVEVEDCHLLMNYFNNTAPGQWGDATQRAAVDGHKDSSDCAAWDALFANIVDPSHASGCALPADQVYDQDLRPRAVRCADQDYEQAIWGQRPTSEWSAVERKIGHGFARRPLDNVGVQYGLEALNSASITADQFVDLNTRIGGLDIDFGYTPTRMQADSSSMNTAYSSGQVTDARQLATVPIIDLRGYSETGEIHTSYHSYRMRARLDSRNGTHANQIIWTFAPAVPILPLPSPALAEKAFLLMDRWLASIEADKGGGTLAHKVIADKPSDATDGCFADAAAPAGSGVEGAGGPGSSAGQVPLGGTAQMISTSPTCGGATPAYDDALGVAGGPPTGMVLKCQLKPVDPRDYKVALTAAQLAAVRKAYPAGVCDWSKPGVGEQPAVPWTTFATGPGGTPLGAPPVSTPIAGSQQDSAGAGAERPSTTGAGTAPTASGRLAATGAGAHLPLVALTLMGLAALFLGLSRRSRTT